MFVNVSLGIYLVCYCFLTKYSGLLSFFINVHTSYMIVDLCLFLRRPLIFDVDVGSLLKFGVMLIFDAICVLNSTVSVSVVRFV